MANESSATIEKPSSAQRSNRRKHPRLTAMGAGNGFSEQAPAQLAALGHPTRDPAAWQAWQKHLARRRSPKPLTDLFPSKSPGKSHPLLWNAPEDARTAEVIELLASAGFKNGKGLKQAGAIAEERIEAGGGPATAAGAIRDLALVHLLPKLAGSLPGETWWEFLEVLASQVDARRSVQLDENADGRAAWLDQLLAGELPLTLAYQFPELGVSRDLLAAAQEALGEGLIGLTDGEGLVHARHFPWLRPLFAAWTRSLAMATSAGSSPWNENAQTQYEWLVRQALRLARSDGSQLFGHSAEHAWQPDLFAVAIDLAGDAEDVAAAEESLPGDLRIGRANDLPCEPAVHSEWSQLGVLRCDWKRGAPRLAVDYAQRDVCIELEAGRETLLTGAWPVEIVAGGKPLPLADGWEEVCWVSDDDVDYLELSAALDGGGRVERQILLAREDRFLYLCDNVVNAPAAGIEYRASLGVADAIDVEPERETREITLVGRKPRALILPIGLPEWRIDPRGGELQGTDGRLHLRQQGSGGNLACPLFIDLQPHRLQRQRTWRQLTVAEALEICPRETASAYRVQCGMAQWLFYRSLAPPANRTFFGQNIATEFFAGRFHRDGEVEELLEIEGEE